MIWMIWMILLAGLLGALVVVIAKKVRPWPKKLLLVLVVAAGVLFAGFKVVFPFNEGPRPGGPFGVLARRVFYTHETAVPGMGTAGSEREVPVSLWLPDDTQSKHPLLIFSHGSFGVENSNLSLFEELASRGFVAASLGHPYHSFVTELSDGRKVFVDGGFARSVMQSPGARDPESTLKAFREWTRIRVEDLSFALDSLLGDERFANVIDRDKVILAGHSLGGAAALEVGRNRAAELRGVVALESPFFGDIVGVDKGRFVFRQDEYPLPVLHFYSDALWGKLGEIPTYAMNQRLLESGNPKFVNVHISGCGHIGLSELSLVSPLLTNLFDGGLDTKPAAEKIAEINSSVWGYARSLVLGAQSGGMPSH